MPSTITELRSVAGRSSDALTTLHARLMSEIPQLVLRVTVIFTMLPPGIVFAYLSFWFLRQECVHVLSETRYFRNSHMVLNLTFFPFGGKKGEIMADHAREGL